MTGQPRTTWVWILLGGILKALSYNKPELATQYNYETGETQAHYKMGAPRIVFNIPFTPKKVEEILQREHPLGLDSINITHSNNSGTEDKRTGWCLEFNGNQRLMCSI